VGEGDCMGKVWRGQVRGAACVEGDGLCYE